jgi:hypothetical protein
MHRNGLILVSAFFAVANLFCFGVGPTQTGTEVYKRINDQPSKIHWCLPQAGNDPANIISNSCEVYKKCLSDSDLDDGVVDRQPFPDLSADQIKKVKSCHQALFNAARSNLQIKGSGATQDWLQHSVSPGTEAKSFSVPNSFPMPK